MKKAFKISLMALLLVASPVVGQKHEPPQQISRIFSNVSDLESSITKGDWDVAKNNVNNVETLLDEISSQIIKSSGKLKHDLLASSLQNLKKVLISKDSSLVFDQLLLLEKLLFQTMENFNYSILPAILVINEHINEAMGAATRRDYERISHEMEEVAIIIGDSSEKLIDIGIGSGMQNDMLNFRRLVINAVLKNNISTLSLELKRMKKLSQAFIWIGRQP